MFEKDVNSQSVSQEQSHSTQDKGKLIATEEKKRKGDIRLNAGERDVHGLDGGEAVVEGADLIGDGEVDSGLNGSHGSVGALVEVGGGSSRHGRWAVLVVCLTVWW